ncbi:hypothetical protein N9Y42_11200 [Mariniblastus sp.]|nr:hypothetical protein [Mariniblastus sp.]
MRQVLKIQAALFVLFTFMLLVVMFIRLGLGTDDSSIDSNIWDILICIGLFTTIFNIDQRLGRLEKAAEVAGKEDKIDDAE